MSRSRSTWQRPVDRWLFLLLLLASVVPFWTVAYVPTQDGPSHLYNAVALRQYVFNPDGIERLYYELNPSPSANWVSHIALALLTSAFSPRTAEKLLLSGYVIAFALSVRFALGNLGSSARGFAILAFPFIGGWALHMGFYNFSFGLAFYFVVLGCLVRTESSPPLRRAAILGGVATALYLIHPLVFDLALLSAVVLVCFGAVLAWRKERAGPGNFGMRNVLWSAFAATIAFLPGVVLQLAWIQKRGVPAELVWLPTDTLWALLWQLAPVTVWEESEAAWATALLLLFVALLFSGLWLRRRDWTLRGSDGFLVLALVLIGFYFLAPHWAFRVGLLSFRLLYFPFFALLLWLGAQRWPPALRLSAQIIAAVIAGGFLFQHAVVYKRFDPYLRDYTSLGRDVEGDSAILALTTGGTLWELEPERVTLRVEPFLHAAGYIAAERGLVYLNNYEAFIGTFPLRFRSEIDPAKHMGDPGQVPPDMDFLRYDERTPASVDYALVWEPGPWTPHRWLSAQDYRRITDSWWPQLREGFDRIGTSSTGYGRLWRRKGSPER